MNTILQNRLWIIALVSSIYFLLCFHRLTMAEVDIDFIIQGVTYNQSLIKDAWVKYRHEIDLGFKPEVGSQKSREEIIGAWKGVKKYVAKNRWIEGQIEPTKTIMAFDGEKTTSWALTSFDAGTGRVMSYENAVGLTEPLTPWWLGYAVWDTQWDKVIMNGTAKLVGTEMIGIHLCYVVQGEVGSLPYKAWFDLERGFMPLRTQMFSPQGELRSTYETIELQKFGGDIWFPIKGTVNGRIGQVTTIFMDEVKINQGVPDSMFVLTWATGTNVWDEFLNAGITVP